MRRSIHHLAMKSISWNPAKPEGKVACRSLISVLISCSKIKISFSCSFSHYEVSERSNTKLVSMLGGL